MEDNWRSSNLILKMAPFIRYTPAYIAVCGHICFLSHIGIWEAAVPIWFGGYSFVLHDVFIYHLLIVPFGLISNIFSWFKLLIFSLENVYYDCLFMRFLCESLWIPVFGWLSVFLGDSAPQARTILRELKHQKRCEEAATTIAAYWHGTQVGQRPPQEGRGSEVTCGTTDPLGPSPLGTENVSLA